MQLNRLKLSCSFNCAPKLYLSLSLSISLSFPTISYVRRTICRPNLLPSAQININSPAKLLPEGPRRKGARANCGPTVETHTHPRPHKQYPSRGLAPETLSGEGPNLTRRAASELADREFAKLQWTSIAADSGIWRGKTAHLSIYPPVSPSACLSLCLSIRPSVRLFVRLPVCLPVCPCVWPCLRRQPASRRRADRLPSDRLPGGDAHYFGTLFDGRRRK